MEIISDLHIHSRHSQATSKNLDIDSLEKYAKIKGLNLLGTGDFTHPEWIKELKQKLTEENGILKTKQGFPFLLQTEISLIYSQDNKGRRIHNVILAPSFDVVQQITEYLLKHGRVDYDGRPIFKIPCPEFTYELKKISDNIEIIPAHIWTPWFSMFGSNSGFNTVEECFKDQKKNIFAIETGLSSDPAMNWRLSQLDNLAILSFSDLHSFWPWRIGREATVFDVKELSYKNIIRSIRENKIKETIEVDPNYGKYHYDGHRNCNISLSPEQSEKLKNICPKCGRPLTIGVLNRVEELADRPDNYQPNNRPPFKSLIPLSEIIAALTKNAVATKKVWAEYYKLVNKDRSELDILLKTPLEELKKLTDEKIADLIIKNREGKIKIQPGFDGEYGYPILDGEIKETELKISQKQTGLSDFC